LFIVVSLIASCLLAKLEKGSKLAVRHSLVVDSQGSHYNKSCPADELFLPPTSFDGFFTAIGERSNRLLQT
jgi:hypothetical protein